MEAGVASQVELNQISDDIQKLVNEMFLLSINDENPHAWTMRISLER